MLHTFRNILKLYTTFDIIEIFKKIIPHLHFLYKLKLNKKNLIPYITFDIAIEIVFEFSCLTLVLESTSNNNSGLELNHDKG